MNIGIVLAAGKGKRFKLGELNKTITDFAGKPLVKYATDLFTKTADKIVVVVGLGAEGVKKAIGNNPKIEFVKQIKRMGTGHAVKIAVDLLKISKSNPEYVWVGYGDHMMFYTPEIIMKLLQNLDTKNKVISMVTCEHKNPDSLVWGRIIRNNEGNVIAIIEQKEATLRQRKIKELNAGFYCFRWDFLKKGINKLKKSPVSGEYYLTDLVKIATNDGKSAVAVKVSFKYVGIGINTREELLESEKLYKSFKRRVSK